MVADKWEENIMEKSKCDMSEISQGLFFLKKISREHIQLSSYSRMTVDLAVEV